MVCNGVQTASPAPRRTSTGPEAWAEFTYVKTSAGTLGSGKNQLRGAGFVMSVTRRQPEGRRQLLVERGRF